jgi:hypothetical protein
MPCASLMLIMSERVIGRSAGVILNASSFSQD